jgi:hypothetical protein
LILQGGDMRFYLVDSGIDILPLFANVTLIRDKATRWLTKEYT